MASSSKSEVIETGCKEITDDTAIDGKKIIESEPEKGRNGRTVKMSEETENKSFKNVESEPLKLVKIIESEQLKQEEKKESEPLNLKMMESDSVNQMTQMMESDSVKRVTINETVPVKTASQRRQEFRIRRKQSSEEGMNNINKVPGGSIEKEFDNERLREENVESTMNFGGKVWDDRTSVVILNESTEELQGSDSGKKLNSKKKHKLILLAGIKIYDMLFNLYLLTLSAYSLKLSTVDCLHINENSPPDAETAKNVSLIPWSQQTVVVMNASKWSMSITDLLTILSVIHIVYAVISIISDYFYFRAPLITGHIIPEGHGNPLTSYMTILSVQRLYFILVSTLDTFLLVSTSNISILTDISVLILIVVINLIIVVDTLFINKSASKVFREGLCCQNPWRNLGILVANLLMGVSNVAHGVSRWTFAAVPNLSLCLLSCLLCVKLLCDNTCVRMKDQDKLDPIVYYLMSISAGNTLGLLVLSTILQKLSWNCL